jgi:hypothetical protein
MKSKLLLTVMLTALSVLSANAQCNPSIPVTAVIVSATDSISGGFPLTVLKIERAEKLVDFLHVFDI